MKYLILGAFALFLSSCIACGLVTALDVVEPGSSTARLDALTDTGEFEELVPSFLPEEAEVRIVLTPTVVNSVPLLEMSPGPGIASLGGIVISEVLPDPNVSGGDGFDTDGDGSFENEDEFVEIYNPTGQAVDISGWELYISRSNGVQDLGHTFAAGTILGVESALVVVRNYGPAAPPAGFVEASDFQGFSLANGGDSIVLYNPTTNEYIGAIYNGETFSAAGLPTGATQVGDITDFGNDTDGNSLALNVNGDPIIDGTPTPGTSPYVPEPTTGMSLALCALLLIRRVRTDSC